MKIAVAQINPIIGNLQYNKKKIIDSYHLGLQNSADIVVLPELALLGYPPLDLVEKTEFRKQVAIVNQEIALLTKNTALLFGSITEADDKVGTNIFNSAILCFDGKIQFIQNKSLIPNYDVFDEVRYFEPAGESSVFSFKGVKLGISVCEDIWNDEKYWNRRRYVNDPVKEQIDEGAEILLNISASPYSFGKRNFRKKMFSALTKANKIPLVYACCVGAQTELLFDGASMIFDTDGELIQVAKSWEEDFIIFDTLEKRSPLNLIENTFEEEILSALILGVKDYCLKLNFNKVLIGLSGGIDSAMVTYIASQAVGPKNVHCILMPSEFSSQGSIDDSIKLCKNLNIKYDILSIQPIFEAYLKQLDSIFTGLPRDITEENLQARIRGMYLMAYSNKFKNLLLTTGNKSEIACGYSTLYGDMCGGLAVIGDVYKTEIYKLANHINRSKEIIPVEIIEKAPSAELRFNQKDQDSLPPYELLDSILKMYLEEGKEETEIIDRLFDKVIVHKVLHLVDSNEFKRKQSAPILRVSSKAFGYGRRYPIVQGWR